MNLQATASKGHHYFKLEVQETGINVEGNSSTIHYSFLIGAVQNGWDINHSNAASWSFVIDGQNFAGTLSKFGGSGEEVLATGDISVRHNDDGTKAIAFAFSVTDNINTSYSTGGAYAITSMQLTNIARTSKVSLNTSSVECNGSNRFTIRTNRASSSFTHEIRYQFGSASGVINSSVGDSVDWVPPKSLLSQIPNANSGVGTITCTTKSGSSTIGSSTVSFTLTVGSSSFPSLSGLSIAEQNSIVSSKAGSNATMALLSTKKVSVNASAKDGASIRSVTVSNNGKIVTLSGSGTFSGTISAVTSGSYVVTVTDSRGNSASTSASQTFYNYSYPTVSSVDFSRTTATGANGTLKASGSYANMLSNTVTVKVTRTGLSEITISASPSGGSWSFSKSYTDLTYTSAFTATIKVTDSFGQTATVTVTLSKSQPTLWIGKTTVKFNGKSMLDLTYPVGSIYISASSTNPGTLFGGTWQEIQGRFLLGRDGSHGAGSTGGEASHTLTVAELPAHNHSVNEQNVRGGQNGDYANSNGGGGLNGWDYEPAHTNNGQRRITVPAHYTNNTGSGSAHNNMPPYLAVYMWKRTA